MMNNIFISYSRNDGYNFANRLYNYLKSNGFEPWLDRRNIKPGELWTERLDSAIRSCWVLLFVATTESVKSRACTAEWNRALTFKKPVVPLLFEDCLLPLLLDQRQFISLMPTRERGLKELVEYLTFLKTPEGELKIMESRYNDLDYELAHHRNPNIVRSQMRRLKKEIKFKANTIANPEKHISMYKREIEFGLLEERNHVSKSRKVDLNMPNRRIWGNLPLGSNRIFKDRKNQLLQIMDALVSENDKKIISIYGKAGSGKTALACEVLRVIRSKRQQVFGLSFHSSQNNNLSFEQIYFASGRIIGGNTEKHLLQVWKDSAVNLNIRINALLGVYQNHSIIILLDNLEVLQQTDGDLSDPDLKVFIRNFCETPHKAKILLTSREFLKLTPKLQNNEIIIPLDKGLPISHAVELLAELGKSRNLGLAHPSKSLLRRAALRVFGYPRALETIVGILDEDPNLSLEELLNKSNIFNRRVLENLVKEAYSRLSNDSQKIIQALAIFERPTKLAALLYMLEPFAANLDVSGELHRLTRGYSVKYNTDTNQYSMHPLDREYIYNQITNDSKNKFNLKSMEKRAASYYVQILTTSDEWQTIEDIEPQFLAFSHLCKAEEYDEAAKIVGSIDSKFLVRCGHLMLVTRMRLQLIEKINDDELRCKNYAILCDVFRRLGDGIKAIDFGQKALAIAERINDRFMENTSLGYLGRTYRNIGRVQEAVEYLERALKIARDIDDHLNEGRHIGNLGSCYYNLGDFDQSIKFLEKSISIHNSTGMNAEAIEMTGHLGNPYFHLGNYEKAIELYSKALTLAQKTHARRGQSYWLWGLGRAYSILGQATKAIDFLKQAFVISKEVEDKRLQCFISLALAETLMRQKNISEAFSLTSKAKSINVPELNFSSNALHGILLVMQGRSNAAREFLRKSIQFAEELISNTERFFEAKYAQALCYATLTVISERHERARMLIHCEKSYLNAMSCCNARGVLDRNFKLLQEIKVLDSSNSLSKIFDLFRENGFY